MTKSFSSHSPLSFRRPLLGLAIVLSVALVLAACSKPTPSVVVTDQAVKDDSVTISKVVSDGPGWLVIHREAGGAPGPVVGYAAVKSGNNDNLVVKIDAYAGTPTLFAMLHKDVGIVGTYEFPGPDVPVMVKGAMVSPPFKVTDLDPRVVVKDQSIKDGAVSIEEVLSNGPGWLVIHADSKGAPGPVIGYAAAPDGLSLNLAVKIDVKKATPTLYAMLHTDAGKVGTYEFPGADVPVMVDGKMVSPPFKAGK
jgi:hypothetical protein